MSQSARNRDWRKEALAAPGTGVSRKVPLYIAGLVAVALIGVITGLMIWLFGGEATDPQYIGMPLCAYDIQHWPPVPFAEADVDGVSSCFKRVDKTFNNQESHRFDATLADFARHKDQPLVVHVTGLAAVRSGAIYVLSSEAKPWRGAGTTPPKSWHRLDRIMTALDECDNPRKLLILDLAHANADPMNGVLANDVSTALEVYLSRLHKDGALPATVLVSASTGETSVAMEEERMSAFGFFLREGLKGAADGVAGEHDHWIKVSELKAYVCDRVPRWVHAVRGAAQHPYLIGDGEFRLTSYRGTFERTEPGSPVPLPEALVAGWELRDEWLLSPHVDLGAGLIRQLETELLNAEAKLRAGASATQVAQGLDGPRKGIMRSWAEVANVVAPKTELAAGGTEVPEALKRKFTRWLGDYETAKKYSKLELDAMADKPAQVAAEVGLRLSNDEILKSQAREANLGKAKRERLEALVGALGDEGGQQFAETMFLRKLRKWQSTGPISRGNRDDAYAAMAAAISGELKFQATIAQLHFAAYPWLRDRLDKLRQDRMTAETELWKLNDEPYPNLPSGYELVKSKYRAVEAEAEAVNTASVKAKDAHETLVDALPRLGCFAHWLSKRSIGDAIEPWQRAVDAATILADAFAAAQPNQVFPSELLTVQRGSLIQALAELQVILTAQVGREPFAGDAVAVLAAPRLGLNRPPPPPPKEGAAANAKSATDKEKKLPREGTDARTRVQYWDKWCLTCGGKHKGFRETEAESTALGALPNTVAVNEAERAKDRARIAVDLARLCGLTIDAATVKNLADPRTLAAWNDLGAVLPLLAKTTPADRADRTGRVLGSWQGPAASALQLRKEFWRFLAELYEDDAKRRDLVNTPFYTQVIKEAGEAAVEADRLIR